MTAAHRSGRRRSLPDALGWGIGLALTTAAISGVSIFINGYAVRQLPDPAVFTTLKNAVAAVLLAALAATTVSSAEVRAIGRGSWARLATIGVIGGSVPFLLFFGGLALASAPSAAFIHKTLFVWVALLAVPFLGERLGLAQIGALTVLVLGQLLIVPPAGVSWGVGETMIGIATLLWAVETIIAKRLFPTTPAAIVGVGRLGIGLVVLLGYLVITGRATAMAGLSVGQWAWIMVTAGFLAGYVATWFAALRRAPASLVTAVLVLGAPVTAALQALAAGALPQPGVVLGQGLVITGAVAMIATVLVSPSRRAVALSGPARGAG